MGQINSTNLPQYVPDSGAAGSKPKPADGTGNPTNAGEAYAPQDDLQLTRLSSVLNTLKKGANAMRSQVVQIMGAVRNGTYQVDSIQVSRSIVGDSLSSR
jgi:anti-sigma28 factor (negative regulator of flagellin synthesis)